ncbi:hypothetical protein ACHAXS_007514 [Conticribra weissflogii]
MIHSADLTTKEVRKCYVTPLITELLHKSSLFENAASLGIETQPSDGARHDDILIGSESEMPRDSTRIEASVNTLFQEISVNNAENSMFQSRYHDSNAKDSIITYCDDAGNDVSSLPAVRSYAEMLEEATALSVYMTRQEHYLVTAISTSCLLSYLIPQCNFLGFLHSYVPEEFTLSSAKKYSPLPLEERLENAIMANHNNSSGGVFPYSAARMRSINDEHDEFISCGFHRFLIQGLGSWLSTSVALGSKPNTNGYTNSNEEGKPYVESMASAGSDLIKLLSMAICPYPLEGDNMNRPREACEMGSPHRNAKDPPRFARSILPFSFQLSYYDRLKMVELCAESLIVNEREDAATSSHHDREKKTGYDFVEALSQLRTALSGFASYVACSEADSILAHKALTSIALCEQELLSAEHEFLRLLRICLESTSSNLVLKLGDVMEDFVTRYNGSRYYADGEFTGRALSKLAEKIRNEIETKYDERNPGGDIRPEQDSSVTEAPTKRQRMELAEDHTRTFKLKQFHMMALLKALRPLFYFLLENDAPKKNDKDSVEETESSEKTIRETSTKFQLMRDITILLSTCSNLSIVRVGAEGLAFALGYNKKYLEDKSNLKLLFRCTWVLVTRFSKNEDTNELDIIESLKPVLVTASRQSKVFAFNSVSCALEAALDGKGSPIARKIALQTASIVSQLHPSLICNVLPDLSRLIERVENPTKEEILHQIKALLPCSISSAKGESSSLMPNCNLLVDRIDCHWTLFQIVRRSFALGCFDVSHRILSNRLLQKCSTQKSFLWLKSLSEIADAENTLCESGASCMTKSLELLNSACFTICSLAAIDGRDGTTSPTGKFYFQVEMLKNRMDFIQLCIFTRALCTEIIMCGGNLPGGTRNRLFLRNCPKQFHALAARYKQIYKLYGLQTCQQTRSSLRTMFAMCKVMQAFVEHTISQSSITNVLLSQPEFSRPKGDRNLPMGALLLRLRTGPLKSLALSKSTSCNTTEMLDVIDAIIKCPCPFPIRMFQIKPISCSFINITLDADSFTTKEAPTSILPSNDDDYVDVDDSGNEVVDAFSGNTLKFILSGVLPRTFLESATIRFSQIIARTSVYFEGQLLDDDDINESNFDESGKEVPQCPRVVSRCEEPFSATWLPGGKFGLPIQGDPVLAEGQYR